MRKVLKFGVFGCLALIMAGAGLALAQTSSDSLISDDPTVIQLSGSGVGYSSPVVAEIDGDTSNGSEIAVAGSDGLLYVYRSDGTLVWKAELPIYSCSAATTKDKVYSSPSVGTLYGDGVPYVVIGYGGFFGKCDGGVVAYRGTDGTKVWGFSIQDFAKKQKFYVYKSTVFSTPALSDVDGDGTLEVGFGGFDRNVYLLNHDGTMRWYYHAADTVWSSPAFADVDSDGKKEMFIGTDITKNSFFTPPTRDGGMIYSFKTDPVTGKFVDFRDTSKKITRWSRYLPQVVFSSPVVADVLSSNDGPELIVGTGCFFPEGTSAKKGKFIKVLSAKDGTVLRTLNTKTCTPSTPAIADVNDDGLLDIIISSPSDRQFGSDGRGRLKAYTPETNTVLWETYLGAMYPFQSPIVADLDYDGHPEVIQSIAAYVYIYDGSTGAQRGRFSTGGSSLSTPIIADFNNDTRPDLVIGAGKGGHGKIMIYPNITSLNADDRRGLDESPAPLLQPWNGWRGGAAHDGLLQSAE